jgi:hypothetical protein
MRKRIKSWLKAGKDGVRKFWTWLTGGAPEAGRETADAAIQTAKTFHLASCGTVVSQSRHIATLGRLIVEAIILLSVRTQADGGKALRAAAQVYGVDTEAITLKVKQEFAAKDKARKASKPESKATVKAKRLA